MQLEVAIAIICGVIVFGCGIITATILQDRAYDRGWCARDAIGEATGEAHVEPYVPEVADPVVWDEYKPRVKPEDD